MEPSPDSEIATAAWASTRPVAQIDARSRRSKTRLIELEQQEGQALFGFALRLGLTSTEAQDAVQETLLRLWAQFVADAAIDDPRGWAYRTIYRVAMDEHRLRRRAKAILERFTRAAGRSSTYETPEPTDLWADVDRLSDRQRQVIYLRYQADLPFDEIGSVLGITASAARSHCTFALAALRRVHSSEASS